MCDLCDLAHDLDAPTLLDRRDLLRKALVAGGAALVGPQLLDALALPAGAGAAEAGAAGAFAAGAETAPATLFERAAMGEDPLTSRAAMQTAATAPGPATGPKVGIRAPRIVSRGAWGADESLRSGSPDFAPIRKLFVHHTVTPNGNDGAAMCRSIYRFHTQGNGWSDIGYNFLVDQHGRVYEGRYSRRYASGATITGENTVREGVIGAHARNYNTGSCGVAMLGTFTDVPPTPAAILALKRVLAWKAGRHGIAARASDPFRNALGQQTTFPNIAGHRDVGQTACPGGGMYALMAHVREHVWFRVRRGLIGYRILCRDGGVAAFGGAFDFSLGSRIGLPMAITAGPDPDGYWLLDLGGNVTPYGTARDYGSPRRLGVRSWMADICRTAGGGGYWVLGADGGVFCFGSADYFGSVPGVGVQANTLKIRGNPQGGGYWILGDDGGIFCFGSSRFYGSLPGIGVRTRAVDFAPTRTGKGYWVLGADGGVFCFGDAEFHGSIPGLGVRWSRPARAIMPSPSGSGYHVVANDGGVFSFGRVPFYGSLAGSGRVPIAMAPAYQR